MTSAAAAMPLARNAVTFSFCHGCDAAGQERGDVQLLPRLEVGAHGNGDLGVQAHGHR
jgi:hypothetical protein